MKTKAIITILVLFFCVYPATADVVWTEGHHEINDGDIYGELEIYNNVTLDIFGGDISVYLMSTDITQVNIFNGNIYTLRTREDSVARIYGGIIQWLVSDEDSIVYLYAYNVTFHPQLPAPGHPLYGSSAWIEGIYINNDVPFSFGVGPQGESYSHINIIPEPTTILLLGLGSMIVIRKRK